MLRIGGPQHPRQPGRRRPRPWTRRVQITGHGMVQIPAVHTHSNPAPLGLRHRVTDGYEEVVGQIKGIRVRTVFNPFYRLSDNLGTCWVARHEMDGPFVLINGDTLFEAAVLQHLVKDAGHFPITLATDQKVSYDDDDMKIWSERDRLCRVGKKLDRSHVNGESIGMMVFHQTGAEIFVRKIEELMRKGDGLKRWYLSAIDELAQTGVVGISSIHGLSWCEVDDPVDFAHAEQVVQVWPIRPSRLEAKKIPLSQQTALGAYIEK